MTGQANGQGGRRNRRTVLARSVVVVIAAMVAVVALSTEAAAAKRPSARPTVPLTVTITPQPGELVVSWSPPTYNGDYLNRFGVAMPYVITDYDLKGVPKASWAACPDLALSCPLVGLKVGHTYKIAVNVWNAKGKHSPWTAPVTVTYTG